MTERFPTGATFLTFSDLILAVDEHTDSPEETALVVRDLLRRGYVRFRRSREGTGALARTAGL